MLAVFTACGKDCVDDNQAELQVVKENSDVAVMNDGGFAIFEGAENVLDYVMEDYMVLANYVSAFPDQTLDAANSPLLKKYPSMLLDYGDVNGSGRIEITGE